MEGLKKVFGPTVLDRVKTYEFHFKDCVNRQAHKLDESSKQRFKSPCMALLKAESSAGYQDACNDMVNFISENSKHHFLTTWFEWWNESQTLIFPVFLPIQV